MESPEGVDVTSAVSNEVDRDDKVMHVLPLATEWPCSAASMALLGGSFAAGVARASHFSGFVTAVAPEQATLPPPPSPSRLRVLRTSPRLRLRCTSSSTARPPVHDSAVAQMESPEGVDVTSAVSDEVDRDDKVTHVLPLAAGWPCLAASMALLGGSFTAGVARASHSSGFVTVVAPEQATLPPPPSPSRSRVLRTLPPPLSKP
uniref:Uncharacterized protein n=1 Tax=Oryza sativa subsp. japonica TaxID=39947 RepID=Q2QYX1_ORYSJ|nr:hypothetical protein LOC_Os12g01310 [Oryza sativa Japonica Group]